VWKEESWAGWALGDWWEQQDPKEGSARAIHRLLQEAALRPGRHREEVVACRAHWDPPVPVSHPEEADFPRLEDNDFLLLRAADPENVPREAEAGVARRRRHREGAWLLWQPARW